METVRIVHPEAGEADVPKSAVPTWRSSGWELASEVRAEESADEQADEADQTDEKARQDSKSSGSRRRSSKESE